MVNSGKLTPVKSVTLVFLEKFNRAGSYWLSEVKGRGPQRNRLRIPQGKHGAQCRGKETRSLEGKKVRRSEGRSQRKDGRGQ
jgi:hypothetical protein